MADLLRNPPDLEQHVLDLLQQIPAGRVTTFGQIAEALGHSIASRWVGLFVRHHHHLPDFVDGSGIMHPRGAGIASLFGVLIGQATVGVTKKLLWGDVDLREMKYGDCRPVTQDGRKLGVAIRHREKSKRPLFVSPGHRIDVDAAVQIVRRVTKWHRLPEPIYWADRISRRETNG